MPSKYVIYAMFVVSHVSWVKTYSWSLICERFTQLAMNMEKNLLSYIVFRAIKEFDSFVSSTVLHVPIDTQNKNTYP